MIKDMKGDCHGPELQMREENGTVMLYLDRQPLITFPEMDCLGRAAERVTQRQDDIVTAEAVVPLWKKELAIAKVPLRAVNYQLVAESFLSLCHDFNVYGTNQAAR